METIRNIQAMVAFEKVARLTSFSAAAQELSVSKAHISKLVQKLEDQLGQRLFNRSTRSVSLTKTGDKFYQACSNSFYNILKVQEEILEQSNAPSGKIKISVAGLFGEDYIAKYARRFLKKYPRVEIELIFEEKMVDLIKENYDFAVRVGHLQNSSLISKKIASRKEIVCASPEYLNFNGVPKTPDDLKHHNCLSPKKTWKLTIDGKIQNIAIHGNFKSNNARTLTKAAVENLGITCLPAEYVNSFIENGQLIPILENFMPEEIPIWLLTPSKKNMSSSVKAFLDEFIFLQS